MAYLGFAIMAVLLLYLLGLGLTILLLPEEWRRFTLIVAPWVGYSYASLACWYVYMCGAKIDGHAACVILLVPVASLVAAIVTQGRSALGEAAASRNVVIALAISAAGFLVMSSHLLRAANSLTTWSLGNYA